MAKEKFYITFSLLLFVYSQLFAQERSVSGIVTDSLAKPIPGVLIYLSETSTTTVFSHTVTDSLGHFAVAALPTRLPFILHARLIGYRSYFLQIDSLHLPLALRIVLHEQMEALSEVHIIGDRLPANNDTTSYQLSQHLDGTERNVEESLKKLPGFLVDEDGTIFYKGVPIKKVFLDGEDLSGDNYQVLTKGLKPDIIAEIEGIERFVENPLLKNAVVSEEAAVNLKLKQDSGKLLGSLDAAYGLENYRTIKANAFYFSGGSKNMFIGQQNNIGFNEPSPATTASVVEIPQFAENNLETDRNPVIELNLQPLSELSTQTNINQETAASLTSVNPIGDKGKWLVQLNSYYDQRTRSNKSLSNFYVERSSEPAFSLNQKEETEQEIKKFSIRNNLTFRLNGNSSLQANNMLMTENAHYLSLVNLQSQFGGYVSQSAGQSHLDNSFQSASQSVIYTKKTSEKSALLINAMGSITQLPQHANFQYSGVKPPFSTFNTDTSALYQQAEKNVKEVSVNIHWLYRGKSAAYKLFTTFGTDHTTFSSALVEPITEDTSSPNNFIFNSSISETGLKYTQSLGLITINNTTALRFAGVFAEADKVDYALKGVFPTTNLQIQAAPNRKVKLSAAYLFDQLFTSSNHFYPNFILQSFRNFEAGQDTLANIPFHELAVGFVFDDKSLALDITGRATYKYFTRSIGYSQNFEDFFSFNSVFIAPSTYSLTTDFEVTKFLSAIASSISIKHSHTSNSVFFTVETEAVNPTLLQNNILLAKIGTAVNFPVNLFSEFSYHSQSVRLADDVSSFNIINHFYKIKTDLLYKKGALRGKLTSSYFLINGNSLTFLDVDFKYLIDKKGINILFSGKNLLNQQNFLQQTSSQFSNTQAWVSLLGRLVLLGVDFNF